jgi:adenosyl cobinamide kinase/adenosyl cobinamide phosphate guanylyltransferase
VITFVLGGARSGKSTVAETIAARTPPVTYVATMRSDPSDLDLTDRLARHRDRRPPQWTTIEPPYDLATVLDEVQGTILVDSLGPWLADRPGMRFDADAIRAALEARTEPAVIVSDEVGLGVHPESELGRRFRDQLGALNQVVASVADECLLVVAGRVLPLTAP